MSGTTTELDILKQLFSNLSEEDKQQFLTSISRSDEIKRVVQPKEVACCPHCQSKHFVKNGKEHDNQRFLCRGCKKSFIAQTGTILYGSQKDLITWEKYIHCMVEKYSLRKCAEVCGINLTTAFEWRHKILGALQNMMAEVELDGVVQTDETYSTVSYKGHHKSFKLPRPAHKRGTRATKRGLSREQVCVPCGVNLDGLSIAKVSNLGKPSLKDLTKVFGNKIAKGSVFVTDSLRPYQKLSLDMSLSHIRIPRGRRAVGTFNIQTINSYHSRLKNMLVHRFKGVATKYLNNYLVYHNFVNFAKDSLENKKVVLLDFIRNTLCSIKSKEVSRLPAIPIT